MTANINKSSSNINNQSLVPITGSFRIKIFELFDKKGQRLANYELPHGATDLTWTTGEYYRDLSLELRGVIETEVKNRISGKFKKFDPGSTKLTPEIIDMDEVWMVISRWIWEKIEEQAHKEQKDIPGLEQGIKEGVILNIPGKTARETTLAEREAARKVFESKLPKINDEALFLTKFKENLYQHFKEKYDIFSEQSNEIKLGTKRK